MRSMLLVPLLIALMLSTACGGGMSDADIETRVKATVEAKEIANANIIHAIATIESEYYSALNAAFSEGIDSLNQTLNQALNSLDGIEVIGVEEARVSPKLAPTAEPLPTSIPPEIIKEVAVTATPIPLTIVGFDRLITYTLPTNNEKQVYKVFTKGIDGSPIGIIDLFINQPQINNYPSDSHTFLNITDRVHTDGANNGLLGLTLDPQYQNNGYFYLNYSALSSKNTFVLRISRFTRNAENPLVANTESEVVLLEIPLP